MDNFNGKDKLFSPESLAVATQVWNKATISLIDIRHYLISPEEAINGYRLPASTFIYTGGKAAVSLNSTLYSVERFGLFHGGKGTQLTLQPGENWLEYYMVLYKAAEPPFQRREFNKLLEHTNPFRQQYGFAPVNPLFFAEQLQTMYECWKEPTSLNLFYGKSAFYQLVYEAYKELTKSSSHVFEPDVAAMARQYLDENYGKEISIQEVCNMLGISYSHFHRSFKQQTGRSPQDYLIHVRLGAAMELLGTSEASLREIAVRCGLGGEQGLYRLFIKKTGMSPSTYRENLHTRIRDGALQNLISFPYNKESQVSIGKLKGKGDYSMLKQIRSKTMVAAALSLVLLLSACSTTPVDTKGEDSTTISAETSQVTETEAEEQVEEETRTVSTVMGDVEIPKNPQRIAVWVYEQEIYSLGVTPVSVSPGNYETKWPDVTIFSYAPDKEELMSLEPDLLITYDDPTFFENYSDIAPVVCIPLVTSAEETLRNIGDLLNMPEQTEELIKYFNVQAEEAKASIEEMGVLGKTAVLVEPLADSIWIYDNAYGRGGAILYDYLGFAIPDVVKNELGDQHFIKVSLELLPQYCDADYIVVVTGEGYDSLKEKTIWQSIPAVKNNKVIEYDVASFDGRGLDIKTLSFFVDFFTTDK